MVKLSKRSFTKRLCIAVVVVCIALLLRYWPLGILASSTPFTTYYPALMIASIYGGFWIGTIATALALTFAYWFHPVPLYLSSEEGRYISLLLFSCNGVFFAFIGGLLRATNKKMHQALQQEQRLSEALNNINAYIYIKDKNRHYTYANKPTLDLFGIDQHKLPSLGDSAIFPPETVKKLYEVDTRVLNSGIATAEEIVVHDEHLGLRYYWEVKTPIFDEEHKDQIWGLCGISTDITDRKLREAALKESEERFRSMFSSAAIGMALVSLDGQFIEVNQALCNIIGYSPEELQKLRFQDITHPQDLEIDLALANELLEGKRESYQLEKRYVHKHGQVIWILLSGSTVHDEKGAVKYFIAQIMDITERKRLLERLTEQAHQDHLTGLYNRRYFLERAESELSRAIRFTEPLSMMMLDIDHFKSINDEYGHKTGDLVLQNLSVILRQHLRAIDIVGRIGGEEFAILLPKTSKEAAEQAAERLRQTIESTPVFINLDLSIHYTASIGVTLLSSKRTTIDTLLSQADMALYQAKNNGRNQVAVFESTTAT